MNKKGFFFTVMALILISFIFISVQLWAQTSQAQEQRYAQKFNTYAMQNAIKMISNESFANFANASMIYAVNKFATALEENPSANLRGVYNTRNKQSGDPNSYPNDPEGTFYFNKSIYELMVYGSTSGYLTDSSNSWPPKKYFYEYMQILPPEEGGMMFVVQNLTYTQDEMRYTLDHYFETTKKAAELIGYEISWGKPTKFVFNQSDEWTIYVSMEVPVNFSDFQGRIQTRKNISLTASFDIHGLTDPYLSREHVAYANTGPFSIDKLDPLSIPHRNIYHIPKYEERDDAKATALKTGSEGLGWFFGSAVWDSDLSKFSRDNYRFNSSKISSYILITRNALTAKRESGSFGAVILVRPPIAQWDILNSIILRPAPNLCVYEQKRQKNCLFCLEYWEELPGSDCNGVLIPDYMQVTNLAKDTIPINPNMTYIVVNQVPAMGGGTYPAVHGSWNYHLNLPEFLIKNEKNFSYICDTNDFECNTDGVLPDSKRLWQKFANTDEHQIWDMTGPRDMAICGFYVKSPYGPSYMQRFLVLRDFDGHTPYSFYDNGIESFNVGAWAGGWLDTRQDPTISRSTDPEVRSRVDYHFYSQTGGSVPQCAAPFYIAMPGCKSWEMCSNNTLARTMGVGRFAITDSSDNPAYDYNIDELLYDPYKWAGVRSCK